jgi:hypothetical protein
MHEFLWGRIIAATAVAALLRHRGTYPCPMRFQWILSADPQLGRAVGPVQPLSDGLAGFASGGFVANIEVAIAQD